MSNSPIVLAITGASGAIYAQRLLELLIAFEQEIHLTISPSGATVIYEELRRQLNLENFSLEQLLPSADAQAKARVHYHHHGDFMAPIASGSFLTSGMVICPCSGSTMSGVAHGASNNLVQRAADVHLKERRRLILVPRETPLSEVQLENMRNACRFGATILPASPGWYHGVEQLRDLVDFIVARILDQLGIPHELTKRWGVEEQPHD